LANETRHRSARRAGCWLVHSPNFTRLIREPINARIDIVRDVRSRPLAHDRLSRLVSFWNYDESWCDGVNLILKWISLPEASQSATFMKLCFAIRRLLVDRMFDDINTCHCETRTLPRRRTFFTFTLFLYCCLKCLSLSDEEDTPYSLMSFHLLFILKNNVLQDNYFDIPRIS